MRCLILSNLIGLRLSSQRFNFAELIYKNSKGEISRYTYASPDLDTLLKLQEIPFIALAEFGVNRDFPSSVYLNTSAAACNFLTDARPFWANAGAKMESLYPERRSP